MNKDRQPRWILGLAVASVVLGIFLRLAWTGDMEYKYDEQYMFERSQAIGVIEPWPAIGMASGVGLANPGLSTWIFVGLARISGATTPLALDRTVIITNCLALLLLLYFAIKVVKPAEREGWLWALALAAVNPFTVQMQRKIWAQSVLPIFCVFFLWSWMRRENRWGAFAWGLIGALLGQIHMSGFFFAAAFLIWSAWNSGTRKIRWSAWLAGSAFGSIPLIPWLGYILANPTSSAKQPWGEILNFRFWDQWANQLVGISVRYSVGRDAFKTFLRLPDLAGHPSYGMAAAYIVAIAAGILILLLGCRALWLDRNRWNAAIRGSENDTSLAQNAGFWGLGGLLSLARVYVHRHYLIVSYPLQFVWIARMALYRVSIGRALLVALWITQFAISAGFLSYIHATGGAPGGDYGVSYSAQHH